MTEVDGKEYVEVESIVTPEMIAEQDVEDSEVERPSKTKNFFKKIRNGLIKAGKVLLKVAIATGPFIALSLLGAQALAAAGIGGRFVGKVSALGLSAGAIIASNVSEIADKGNKVLEGVKALFSKGKEQKNTEVEAMA